HPASAYLRWEWAPSRPLEELLRFAVAEPPGAIPANGMGPRFPHAVGQGDLSPRFYKALRSSPAGTALTLLAAEAAVDALSLSARRPAVPPTAAGPPWRPRASRIWYCAARSASTTCTPPAAMRRGPARGGASIACWSRPEWHSSPRAALTGTPMSRDVAANC